MTTVYFVRHAESDLTVHDDLSRPLTEKGMNGRALVTNFLADKNIDKLLSSPYKRTMDTIGGFAEKYGLQIETIDDFRERRVDSIWLSNADIKLFMERQWNDFEHKFSDGECLREVQERNIAALNDILNRYNNKNIAIGTHGTALSTIINYYDQEYGYKDFTNMVKLMPWIVKMAFDGHLCLSIEKIQIM